MSQQIFKIALFIRGNAIFHLPIRVTSGNFRHRVNSDIPLQTVEIQMRRLLIRIFTVCLV